MPADPIVSPADTIRQALTEYLPDGFRDEDGVWHDGPVLQDALAALAALLAVGERDKAERDRQQKRAERAEQVLREQVAENRTLVVAGERDRRQIARLTGQLRQLLAWQPLRDTAEDERVHPAHRYASASAAAASWTTPRARDTLTGSTDE